MPTNITDVDAFTDPIVTVADGDPVAAATDDPADQGLADRTRYLLKRQTPALTTAAGSSRSDAASIVDCNTIIQSGGANRGILFTTAQRGLSGRIWNPTAYAVKLYPIVGETLLELRNVGVTTPYPTSANDSPITIPAYSFVDWCSNLVGPGAGGAIPGSPAWTWIAKVNDDVTRIFNGLEGAKSGSWTPALATGSTNNFTHSTQTGRYSRVGNLVCLSAYVVGNTGAGSTGSVYLTGFPYTPNADGPCGMLDFRSLTPLASAYGHVCALEGQNGVNGAFIYPNVASGSGTRSADIGTAFNANSAFSCIVSMTFPTNDAF